MKSRWKYLVLGLSLIIIVPALLAASYDVVYNDVEVRGELKAQDSSAEAEGTGLVTPVHTIQVAFDPTTWYDVDTEVFLFEVDEAEFPNGIKIVEIEVKLNTNAPATEIVADLRYANDFPTLTGPVDIDVIGTASGSFAESDPAQINGGTAIAAGKVVYIGFDENPTDANRQMHVKLRYIAPTS